MKVRTPGRRTRSPDHRPSRDTFYVGAREVRGLRLRPLLPPSKNCAEAERNEALRWRLSRQGRDGCGEGGAVLWRGRIISLFHWAQLNCCRSHPAKFKERKAGRGRPFVWPFDFRVGICNGDADVPF